MLTFDIVRLQVSYNYTAEWRSALELHLSLFNKNELEAHFSFIMKLLLRFLLRATCGAKLASISKLKEQLNISGVHRLFEIGRAHV